MFDYKLKLISKTKKNMNKIVKLTSTIFNENFRLMKDQIKREIMNEDIQFAKQNSVVSSIIFDTDK